MTSVSILIHGCIENIFIIFSAVCVLYILFVPHRFKNGREVHSAGRVLLSEGKDGEFKLTITEVWDTDEGEYACVISNSLGSEKCFARMIIAGRYFSLIYV